MRRSDCPKGVASPAVTTSPASPAEPASFATLDDHRSAAAIATVKPAIAAITTEHRTCDKARKPTRIPVIPAGSRAGRGTESSTSQREDQDDRVVGILRFKSIIGKRFVPDRDRYFKAVIYNRLSG